MAKIKYIIALLVVTSMFSDLKSQEITVFEKFSDFEHLLKKENDTTYVVNFWATWCKPCVEELPGFEKINREFADKKFKMLLVSLDFDTQLESKVKPFINKNNISTEVVMLTDTKQNSWIDKVNPDWSGSIPVTVIYNSSFYFFREGSMTYDELKEIITKNINQ